MKNNRFFVFRFILLLLIFVLFSFVSIKNVSADEDTTPPVGSISINNGNLFTNSREVTLNLLATDDLSGVAEMQFNNGTGSYSSFESYATTKAWTLSASGDGLKTVRVKYKDGVGNVNTTGIASTITLDTLPPVLTLNGDSVVNLNIGDVYTELGANALDAIKGNFVASSTGVVDTSMVGIYTVTYNAIDDAGNSAVPVIRTINVLDPIILPPPVVTLSSIDITTPANKLNYNVGENIDLSGLVVTGTYSDGSTNVLAINNLNIFGFDSSSVFISQPILITFEGKTAIYYINITTENNTQNTENVIQKHKITGSYPIKNINQILNIDPIKNTIDIPPKKEIPEIENIEKEENIEFTKNNEIKNNISETQKIFEPVSQTANASNASFYNIKWIILILFFGIILGVFLKIKKFNKF